MKHVRFAHALALSGCLIFGLPGPAPAQSNFPLQTQISFAAQYDTNLGWRPTYGNPSVHNPMAAPTIAAGSIDGQTHLLLGANNSIGNFFDALHGPDNYHNAQQDLASVYSGLLPQGYIYSQPQVLRDTAPFQFVGQPQTGDRYVIGAVANNPDTQDSRIVISATQYLSLGNVAQCLFWFNANSPGDNSLFADSPHFGMSGNALLITADMYRRSDSAFQYAKLWMYPKTWIYNDPSQGTCPSARAPAWLELTMPNSDGSLPFSVIPAKSTDTSPTAYLVNSLSNGGSSLTLWVLDTTDPTTINGQYGPVPTNSYSTPPNAEQAGTSTLITTWDVRLFNAVYQPGSGLWTVNTTACTPDGDTAQRSCLQWYQIDPSSFTTQQQGLVHLAGHHLYAPGLAANNEGDAVLAFNSSGTDQYVGIYYAGRHHTDPPNTLQPIWRIKSGEGCYQPQNGPNTVSLFSEVTVDPTDDSLFWFHSGYAFGSDSYCPNNDWATGVGAVRFVANQNGASSAAHSKPALK